MSPRIRWAFGLALLVSGSAMARDLPNYHSVFSQPLKSAPNAGLRAVNQRLHRPVSASASEPRFALPTVLRAPFTGKGAVPLARTPVDAAREHLKANAAAYFLKTTDIDSAVVKQVHDTGRGAVIVKFVSRPGDIEVWGEELNVVMDRQLRLVGMTGYLSTPDSAAGLFSPRATSARGTVAPYALNHSAAVAAAYGDLTGSPLGAGAFAENGVIRGEYHGVFLRAGISTPSPLSFPARSRQVLFHRPGTLEPAYYVEVASPDPVNRSLAYYSYVISGRDGSVLARTNLAAHATPFTYRVWADSGGIHQPFVSPVGNGETPAPGNAPSPPYVIPAAAARNDISLVSGPISTGDPWLPDNATTTFGNNVHAYADLGGFDGFTPAPDGPDYAADVSSPGMFQYDWSDADGANTSVAQNKAAITQLFYIVNWLHDWYYDNGFDEASGNAQTDNYGRGPPGGDQDPIYAETNDFSGVDNANMWTPADGSPPRMQMYVFDGPSDATTLTTNPDVGLGTQAQGFFKPMSQGLRNFDVTAEVVRAQPANACAPLSNAAAVAGKIVLIDRGTCTFDVKAGNGVAAGAVGVLIWNATNGNFAGNFGAARPDNTVGNIIIDFPHGQLVVNAVASGTVVAHMARAAKDLDGALDEAVVAHEWGHYIQHRLIAAGAQDSQQGAGMGEGWSDFHGLLFLVREGQDSVAGNANWMGAYAVGNYVSFTFNDDERWFGIRRATYSADPAKNHTTFKYIGTAVDGSSVSFPYLGTAGDNPAEVHNTGEIWAAMLFDCYVSMLQNHPFAEAQNTMKDYIVASYKVTPPLPTFVEARDALLQVVAAHSMADYDRFGQAFAGRGLGIGAVAPDRGDNSNSGVVESFDWGANYSIQSVSVVDGGTNCDGDGVLDPGETGAVEVTIRNIGKSTLTGVTATASSTTTGATFPTPTATFADVAPGSLGTARIPIALASTFTDTSVHVDVSVTGTVGTGGTATQTAGTDGVANLDEVATQDTDTFSTVNSNWSILVEPHTQQPPPGTVWFRALGDADSDDGTAFVATTNVQSDESVLTPPIHVAATGDFTLAFTHIFANLAGPPTVSGVVVELSDDDGATWTDMAAVAGATITGGYNGTIDTESPLLGANERNPLEGRDAFTGVSPTLDSGTFAFDQVTANFHAVYAGKTVLVRFRYGSPFDGFNTQWLYELDDVQVSGVSAHPFLEDVADQKICVPIPDAGPDQVVNEQSVATLHGAAPDLSGGAVTHAWTQVDGPAVTLSDPSSFTPTFATPLVDADTPVTFKLTATGTNGVRSATTHVVIHDVGHPPVARITGAGVTIAPGATVNLSAASSTDADGDALTYTWSQTAGSPGTFSSATGATTTFTAPSSTGSVTIGLKATDSKGLTSSTTGALSIQKPPDVDNGGCSSTASPASAMALLVVGAFLLLRRRGRA
jgi:MYXO-CTERM domain-containing protein